MKFGTQDQAFFPRDILEKFRFIKDCGFEEYEIDGKLLIENIDTVKQAIKETGIPVVIACNGYDGWIGDFIEERRLNGVRQIAEILRALSEVGGKGIVIPAAWGMFTYRLPPMVSPRSKEGDYKAVSESLRYLDKVAEETGTVIYLEPLNRYQDHMINLLADARHYIDSNQLKHVQIIADFYHMNIEEDDISKALTTQKEYVGHIHLADNHRYQPGSGAIDFTRHFQTLLQNEYEGYMVYECRLRGENEVKIYQESLQYLKNCLETARHLNDLEKE
ncbi:sugar phosphate isomerase/epimerase [Enterococcus faecium]|nr:sugar phosphate isomerase/epimerase [Enterococcus faecium]